MYISVVSYIFILSHCFLIQVIEFEERCDSLDATYYSTEEKIISEFTGLDDEYDLNKENPIDSVVIFCCLPRDFEIHIYKDNEGYAIGEDGEKERLSDLFSKATLEDVDALFIQNSVPVELSREENEFYISGNPCYLNFKIYYGDKNKEVKVVFDSKFDIKYSVRFDNLYRRLTNIGQLLYRNSYYYGLMSK